MRLAGRPPAHEQILHVQPSARRSTSLRIRGPGPSTRSSATSYSDLATASPPAGRPAPALNKKSPTHCICSVITDRTHRTGHSGSPDRHQTIRFCQRISAPCSRASSLQLPGTHPGSTGFTRPRNHPLDRPAPLHRELSATSPRAEQPAHPAIASQPRGRGTMPNCEALLPGG